MRFETLVYTVVMGSVAFLCYYALLLLPRQIRRDYREGIQALARAVEVRENGTTGSARRRGYYANAVARRLGISAQLAQDIELAALLQEIGKVTIPYSILNKADTLTDDEREVLKLHPVLSQRMVEQVPSLARLAPLIRHHHEHWDGTGYPDRLQGEEIPLASRILHVVGDYVEAMRGKDFDDVALRHQVLAEMKAGKGSLYDPRVLEALEAVVRAETSRVTTFT